MSETKPRLALLSPLGVDAASAEKVEQALSVACRETDIAAVILRLAPNDPRALTSLVKRLAPAAQQAGAAVIVSCPGVEDLPGVAARGGADGVHVERANEATLRALRGDLRDGRILGVGGLGESRHAAMAAGEAGADYVMFGGLYPDGASPEPDGVQERAAWWAEIFETPCIAVAVSEDEIDGLAATGAEFVGLEAALWIEAPGAVARIGARLSAETSA